jgi:hypothetical protein
VTPAWKSYNWTALTSECQAEFRRINLRWHDLRHEYASRLVERGVPLAQVRDLLGHVSITTTERYDNQKLENLQLTAARLESGKTFDASEASTVRLKADTTATREPRNPGHRQSVKFLSRVRRIATPRSTQIAPPKRGLTLRTIRIYRFGWEAGIRTLLAGFC